MKEKIKRNINLMIENGEKTEIDLIKEYCKNNNIQFGFRYQRKGPYNERNFKEDKIEELYYFYIVGDTNDYNNFINHFKENLIYTNTYGKQCFKINLTDYSFISNIADMDNSFEENLKEILNDCRELQNKKKILNNKFLKFIMSIENVEVLEELKKYHGNMNEELKTIIRDRIDILNNNRDIVYEEFTASILSLNNDVKALREKTGMNRREFCNYFGIPYRTVEDWENKKSACSNYLFKLMKEKLEQNKLI